MLVDTNTVRSINGQKYLKKKFSGHLIIKEQTLMTFLYHNQATRQSTEMNFTDILVPLFLSVHVCTHTLTGFPPTLLSESGTARHLLRHKRLQGRPRGSVVKNPPANAGDTGLLPGSGRSPGEGNSNHSSIPAWEIPWTEEPGR